ncbi:SRPBCC family protein [Vallicoccus soli]|uniref:SRPBCC domain-containing protein n=1 Tax=Vallicoccus soli TaxID=2339232 RepID=A0A3A3YWY6_9ACTN|nr:SRPBCC domain-containing protein [Vallicoccus soli]RJK96118.1 SRPBCC domain-containing protein [Vallicoccus soli]
MSVVGVAPDREARTLTMTAEYDAPVEQVWRLWADPRLLERWWGPPTYPATVHEHDLRPGGRVVYSMTGPEGDTHYGWWRPGRVDPPTGLELEDGFGDADGTPAEGMPTTRVRVDIADAGGGRTRMTVTSTFPSAEAMDQMLQMGMAEGMREALGQTYPLLEGSAA